MAMGDIPSTTQAHTQPAPLHRRTAAPTAVEGNRMRRTGKSLHFSHSLRRIRGALQGTATPRPSRMQSTDEGHDDDDDDDDGAGEASKLAGERGPQLLFWLWLAWISWPRALKSQTAAAKGTHTLSLPLAAGGARDKPTAWPPYTTTISTSTARFSNVPYCTRADMHARAVQDRPRRSRCGSCSECAPSGGIFDSHHRVYKTLPATVLVHRHESTAKRPGPLATATILRERWAADGDERALSPARERSREAIHYRGPSMVIQPGHATCFFCRSNMAPGERHTPCHDVIQGTCRIRRSGPFLGPSLPKCVVDNHYFSSLLLRAQLVAQSAA
ncbi:hypothetical protein CFE70_003938 [Pyrenophora teres f. teres 0-1]